MSARAYLIRLAVVLLIFVVAIPGAVMGIMYLLEAILLVALIFWPNGPRPSGRGIKPGRMAAIWGDRRRSMFRRRLVVRYGGNYDEYLST